MGQIVLGLMWFQVDISSLTIELFYFTTISKLWPFDWRNHLVIPLLHETLGPMTCCQAMLRAICSQIEWSVNFSFFYMDVCENPPFKSFLWQHVFHFVWKPLIQSQNITTRQSWTRQSWMISWTYDGLNGLLFPETFPCLGSPSKLPPQKERFFFQLPFFGHFLIVG